MADGQPVVGSPEWWLLRLLRRLQLRQPELALWDDYYRGLQPLAFASAKFKEAFGERFPAFTSNFCELVVNGTAERLEVAGFRFGSKSANDTVWRDVWQANDLDAGSQLAHQEALIKGVAYALIEPGEGGPVVTIEDACDAITEADPKDRQGRRAGLKRWVNDEGHLVVYLYLPEFIFKYVSQKPWTPEYSGWWLQGESMPLPTAIPVSPGDLELQHSWGLWQSAGFEPLEVPGEAWPLPNLLGTVPLVELANRPRLKRAGQSEIAPIRSNQDAVNKYRCDALIASEFAAFPQRYLLNFEPEVDPDTGRAKEPFRAAIDRLWTVPPPDPDTPDAPQPVVGQFAAASLEPYVRMIELEVGHIGSISRMPYHELLASPSSTPPSAESIKSSEAGLVRKVGRAEIFLGEGWEEAMRVALLALEDPAAKFATAETVWADSETRNEAVRTDAVVKLFAAGVIDGPLAWEMIGLTRAQQEALLEREKAKALLEAAQPEPAPAPAFNGAAGAPALAPAPTGPRMSPAQVPPPNGGNYPGGQ